ncbi:MAG: tRNA (adenosine(37)-N6)-dimethylallyltransferase MiaA [Dehalococcoidia bacterium]
MNRLVVAIVGPTATGKSGAALQLAQTLGGEIVNADSRQIYRGMDIGTAKPTAEERKRIPHHLYDICDPRETFSLALFKQHALAAFEKIWAKGSFAWLVGGTGQYVWGLLEDWNVPEVPPDEPLRAELTAFAEANGPDALHERLRAVDPIAAERIDARNIRRVVRALEVHFHTGTPISTWQTKGSPGFQFITFGLKVERDELDRRIDARVDAMFRQGFVDEVRTLIDGGVPREVPAMSSIGYAQVAAHLAGEISLAEAVESTQRATRKLARRQQMWFRADDSRIQWVRSADAMEMEANIFTGVCANAVRGTHR